MPRKLYDIDVEEITLCESAANRTQFFIKKSREKKMDKFIEALKGFVVDEDDDELTEEEIAKAEALEKEPKATIENAVNTLSEYKESMPDDLLAATKILVKAASFIEPPKKEDIDKAGAALSKTTKTQISKALEHLKGSPQAIGILKTLLGQKVEKEVEKKEGEENLNEETQAKLEKLAEYQKAEKEKIEKEEKEAKEKAEEEKQDMKDRLEALEKKKGIKKSIDDDGDDDDDKKKKKKDLKKGEEDETEDNWPSLYVPGLE